MSETEHLLAPARLQLRRDSPGWRRVERPAPRQAPSGPLESIAFLPDPSMDTSASLSRANRSYRTSELGASNRLKLPKRLVLRGLRFYTDRQETFNADAARVLNGYAELLNRLAGGAEALKRETAIGLRQLGERVEQLAGELGALREGVAAAGDSARRGDAALRDELSGALESLRGEAARRELRLAELGGALGALRSEEERREERAREFGEAVAVLRSEGAARDRTLLAASDAASVARAAAERHESLLGELREGVAALRAVGERVDRELRDAAAAAVDATRASQRHERRLGEVAGEAERLARELALARGEAAEALAGLARQLAVADDRIGDAQQRLDAIARRARGIHGERMGRVYAHFEDRFRGPREEIDARSAVYTQRVVEATRCIDARLPFLDLGCGRGELVAALRSAGLRVEGVEANAALAEACASAGLPVRHADLFEDLRARPDGGLSGLAAIQVVEHLEADALLELLELARAKIAESGLLVLETIDVRSVYALRWFFADPTHVLPLMPDTLRFYVETAGFEQLEVLPLHPVPDPVAPAPGGSERIRRISSVVFGDQDFALLARRPPVPVETPKPVPPPRRTGTGRPARGPRASKETP
jgi:SAM-dependent methyltransferase